MQRLKKPTILLVLIALYWFTRLININVLALFLDEAYHLWWARDVWFGHPFAAAESGRWLNILWMSVFYPFNATVWVARVSVILLTTVGFACILGTLRHHFSLSAAIAGGLLYTFMPLTFFFERLALADSLSAPFVAIAVWIVSVKLQKPLSLRQQILWSILGGLSLTGAVLSKISNLIFLCIPAIALLSLFPFKEWRRGLQITTSIYLACAFSLLPTALILRFVFNSSLGLNLVTLKTGGAISDLPAQIIASSQTVVYLIAIYLPFPMWLIVLLGILLALWKSKRIAWFIASVLAITVSVLVIQTKSAYIASRFLPAYAPLIAILVGGGLTAITISWRRPLLIALTAIMLLSGVTFAWQGWTDPTQLALGDDHWHYVSGWPSGYGLREVALDFIKRDEQVQLVTLDLGSSQKLDGYLLGRTTKVTSRWYRGDFSLANSILVIDSTLSGYNVLPSNIQATEIARYERPGNLSPVIVYRVAP